MTYWTRITKPHKDSYERKLFNATKPVYETLFPSPAEQEPWQNFEDYLTNTEEYREKGDCLEAEDFFYVALYEGKVCGLAYLDIYYEESIGAISYVGILNHKFKTDLPYPPATIRGKMILELFRTIIPQIGSKARCQWLLFEVEHVNPLAIGPKKNTKEMTLIKQRQYMRRNWVDMLQKRFNAKKIGWINYQQSKIEWNKNQTEHPLHLLVTSFAPEYELIDSLSRQEIKDLVKFTYLTWYYEGYECTEKGPNRDQRLENWYSYLKNLYKQTVHDIPKTIKLQPIDLTAQRKRIFISYPHKHTYIKISSKADLYLKEHDFPTFYWPTDQPKLIGNRLNSALIQEMDKSDIFILFLGNATFSSKGQIKELEYLRQLIREERDIKIIPLLKNRINSDKFSKWIPIKSDGDDPIIYQRYNATNYYSMIEIIASNLLDT